jgi:hypothetical protein
VFSADSEFGLSSGAGYFVTLPFTGAVQVPAGSYDVGIHCEQTFGQGANSREGNITALGIG